MKNSKTTIDHNSTVNQEIKRKLVSRDVYCNVTYLMEENKGWETGTIYEEIENLYTYPEYNGTYVSFYGGTEEEKVEAIEQALTELDTLKKSISFSTSEEQESDINIKSYEFEEEIQELKDLESEPQEILEWWAVSKTLFDKLKEKGEPVYESGLTFVWGRTCSGQAILLDGVISKICEDMEILEGQKNSWEPGK